MWIKYYLINITQETNIKLCGSTKFISELSIQFESMSIFLSN